MGTNPMDAEDYSHRPRTNTDSTTVANTDSTSQLAVAVFPNPSNSSFTFTIAGVEQSVNMQLKIEYINGRAIDEIQKNMQPGSSTFNWDANNINQGIYFYSGVLSNGQIFTGKLIKM